MRECRDTLEEAIKARKQYREVMKVVTNGCQWHEEEVDSDMEFFEKDLNEVLNVSLQLEGSHGRRLCQN